MQLALRHVVGRDTARIARDELVDAEMLALEQHAARQAEVRIEVAIERGLEAIDVDTQRATETHGVRAVQAARRLHRLAATVANQVPAVDLELVALCVPAEVVERIEHEDAGVGFLATVVPRRREATDPSADHDEIVAFLRRDAVDREHLAVAQRVCDIERTGRGAAQSGARGWIAGRTGDRGTHQLRGNEAGADGQCRAIEKIAPRDVVRHLLLPLQSPARPDACGHWTTVAAQARQAGAPRRLDPIGRGLKVTA